LGVPFLAGSAIKGLLRAWIEKWDTESLLQALEIMNNKLIISTIGTSLLTIHQIVQTGIT